MEVSTAARSNGMSSSCDSHSSSTQSACQPPSCLSAAPPCKTLCTYKDDRISWRKLSPIDLIASFGISSFHE